MDGDGGVLVEPQEHDPGQVEPGITTDEPAQEEEPQVPVESQAEGDEQVQQQAEPQAESLPEPSGPIEEHLAQQAPPPVVEEHKVPASAELEEVPPPPPAGVFEDENEAPPYMNDGTDDPTNAAWGKHPRSGIITKPDPLQTKTTPAAEESIRPDSARRRRKCKCFFFTVALLQF